MSAINDYYAFGELSFAAYSDLFQGIAYGDYVSALMRGGKGMSQLQAQNFANTYTVIDQYNDPNGLSVTLFEDANGKQTVAIRGTNDLQDFLTDAIDIAILGSTEYQSQYHSLSSKVQQWLSSGDLQSGFTVTGHSLGGFLAQALAAEFDSDVSAAYTYNAPGFTVGATNIGTEFLDIFGIVDANVPNDKIVNVRALEGVSATAGLGQMLGSIEVVSIENQSPNLIANHYMVPLVDSLAVHNLFAQVDSTLTTEEVTGIIQASSSNANNSLESAVSTLGNLLATGFIPRTGIEYDANRDDLFSDIQKITNGLGLTANLTIEVFASTDAEGETAPFSSSGIENLARSDIAYRYALVNLNPFAVLGANYDTFNQNGELDIYDPATGQGQLSNMYLADRSAMLSFLIQKNINDGVNESIIRFEDKTSGEVVLQSGLSAPQYSVVFGSDQGEDVHGTRPSAEHPYIGYNFNDHLYGMEGDETIYGYSGDDYLEGGKGQDTLNGGDGNDTFFVLGEDNAYDVFNGGDGDEDTIKGSEGNDTIRVNNFSGENSIEVIDGGGGHNKLAGTGVEDVIDISQTIMKNIQSIELGDGHDILRVKNLGNSSGLNLIDGGSGLNTLEGTDEANTIDLSGIMVNHIQQIQAKGGADKIIGSAGVDYIYGGSGNDTLIGGSGEDYLYGGEGFDYYKTTPGQKVHIYDSDGLGIIDDGLLSGSFIKTEENQYSSFLNPQVTATKTDDGNLTLRIPDGTEIVIENFENSDLSISLLDSPGPSLEDSVLTLTGSDAYEEAFAKYGGNQSSNGLDWYWYVFGNSQGSTLNDFGVNEVPALDISGAGGNDFLTGLFRSDHISGGDGNDVIAGYNTTAFPASAIPEGEIIEGDLLDGGAGKDFIFGSGGDDIIVGGTETDFLEGLDGTDSLDGGSGNDALAGGSHADTLMGGEGNDLLSGDGYFSGAENITVDFLHLLDVSFSYTDEDEHYMTGSYIFGAIPHHEDPLVEGGNDILFGGSGNDQLWGGGGDDVLHGEDGNDALIGGAGNDLLIGGDGTDVLGLDGVNLDLGDDILDGGEGDDLLYGAAGDETLLGSEGDDLLSGADGNDILDGGAGNDTLFGGNGNDCYFFGQGSGEDRLLELLGENDVLKMGKGITPDQIKVTRTASDLYIEIPETSDRLRIQNWFEGSNHKIETIEFFDGTTWDAARLERHFITSTTTGTDEDDTITGLDGENNEIIGLGGNDDLSGGNGDDIIYGGIGDDTLTGNFGDDTLVGGAGNDSLAAHQYYYFHSATGDSVTFIGGPGNDSIFGGSGSQTQYIFASGDGQDSILDFGGFDDTVFFTEGILQDDVQVTRQANDLILSIPGSEDQLTLRSWFGGRYNLPQTEEDKANNIIYYIDGQDQFKIEQVEFADGMTWDVDTLYEKAFQNNNAPELITPLPDQSVQQGQPFHFSIPSGTFNDSDIDDELTFTATLEDGSPLPAWLEFHNGFFECEFPNDQSDTLYIKVVVDDRFGVTVSDSFQLSFFDSTNLGEMLEDGTILITTSQLLTNASVDNSEGYFVRDLSSSTGTLVDNGNDTWSFTPEANWNGSTSFSYVITNGPDELNASADLTVAAVNDAPTVTGEVDLGMINEGTPVVYSTEQLLAMAADVENDTLAVENLTANHGSFVNNGNGTWTYLTETGYAGPVEISYSVEDGQGGSAPCYAVMEIYPPHVNLIPGTENDETLYGTSGDDAIAGKGGNDTLDGGTGNDTLIGSTGNDYLLGGSGDDLLIAGQGNDLVDGGQGQDLYLYQRGDGLLTIRDEGINTLRFGPGISSSDLSLGLGSLLIHIGVDGDEIHIENFSSDDVYGQIAINRFEFADGTVLSYEELLARGFDLEGTDNEDFLEGTNINDRIKSLAGDDTITAKAGDDTLDGGSGDDTLFGGEGDDYLYGGDDGLGGGYDYGGYDYGGYDYGGTAPNDDYLDGGTGNDTLDGGSGNDTLFGGEGDDYLYGGDDGQSGGYDYGGYDYGGYDYGGYDYGGTSLNDDYLDGGAGNDTLDGGSGNDTLFGGEGDDYLYGGDDGLGGGYDYGGYDYGGYDYGGYDYGGYDYGGYNYGGTTSNDDYLDGGAGNDTLDGGSGDDTLLGGEGDGIDTIYGGSGNDLLNGGSGIDTMAGGSGDDVYYVDGYAEVTVIPGEGDTGTGPDHGCGSHHKPHQHNWKKRHKHKGNEGVGNGGDPPPPGHDQNYNDGPCTGPGHPGQKPKHQDASCHGQDHDHDHNDNDDHGSSYNQNGSHKRKSFHSQDNCHDQECDRTQIACQSDDNCHHSSDCDDQDDKPNKGHRHNQNGNNHNACYNQGNHHHHGGGHNSYNDCHNHNSSHNHGGCDDPGNEPGEEQTITTYFTDTVTEEADMGYDVVYSSITYSLTDHVEELHLTGTDNFDGIGNDLDNRIVGNSGDNTLDGGLGNDLLEGGAGNDTYLFGSGQDTILDYDTAADQNDTVEFSEGLGVSDIGLCQSGNDLLLGIAGSDDTLRIENWFQSTDNQVENVQLADGNHLTDADINQLIQQMSAYAVDQGIAFNNINDVYNNQDMMTLVANSWQSS